MPKRRPAKKTDSIEIRLDPETKRDFMRVCESQKRSASAVIRGFIGAHIAQANRAPTITFLKEFDMTRILKSTRARIAGLAGCVAAGLAIATPSAAADARLEAVFQWLDANHDKALSRSEFIDPARTQSAAFDGVQIIVTAKGERPQNELRSELFARLDKNRDRKVTLNELDSIVIVDTILNEPILNADQDGDERVTEAELAAHITARRALAGEDDPAAGAALMARGIIGAHDGDVDGAVGPSDFAG